MKMIADNYRHIERQLISLCQAHNLPDRPLILPVSKRKPVADIRTLYDIGVRDFAENYWQEAQLKVDQLSDYTDIRWHYIGKIQSKKCKHLARQMAWVHTVDDIKQAVLLDKYSGQYTRREPLNVCIQVNLHEESQKNGVTIGEVPLLTQQVATLSYLRLRGLMLIGQFGLSKEEKIASFIHMQELFDSCKSRLASEGKSVGFFDTLSMGMSADWCLAMTHGATIVRLGTTIFGARD